MQTNTRPTGPPPRLDDLDAGLAAPLLPVIASARRRATRDGDRQIDTAHLLHSLLEADPRAREAFAPAQLARLLGYLVQRSIGFGLQWQGSVEESGALPLTGGGTVAVPAPAQAPGDGARGQPGGSPTADAALRRAVLRARGRGRQRAEGVDVLAALAGDGDSRAVEVLRFAGVDPAALVQALPR